MTLKIPDVSLAGSDGKNWHLPADLKGKYTVIYFYPKDDTPGCTIQACSYRDNLGRFSEKNVNVLGVSADSLESHHAFIKKFALNFTLLADTEHVLADALGVWGEQQFRGKTFMGLSRDSFLVNPDGEIIREWRRVNPEETVDETLDAVVAAQG